GAGRGGAYDRGRQVRRAARRALRRLGRARGAGHAEVRRRLGLDRGAGRQTEDRAEAEVGTAGILREPAQPLSLRRGGKGAMLGRQTVRRLASIGIVALAFGARAEPVEAPSPVTRVHGIATGLAACWRPPHDDDQVTVSISFTREGAVIGEPRIVFVRSSGGRADDTALADSMMSAIRDCTPLHFSARIGAAIAGQVLNIRFIGRSRATIVAPP